jgi:hypothetical protein
VIKLTVVIVEAYHCYQLHTQFYPITSQGLSAYVDEIIGDHCGFWHNSSTTDQIFCICHIIEIKWEYNETVHQLFIDFNKAYDSVRREVLYSIPIEFRVPMELVKMCLNKTYSKVGIGKHLSDIFAF